SKMLSDNIIITITGDTFKSPTNRQGWGDGTPGNSNVLYVFGNGYLKTGWIGNIALDGTVSTWNADTGATMAGGTSAAMAGPPAAPGGGPTESRGRRVCRHVRAAGYQAGRSLRVSISFLIHGSVESANRRPHRAGDR